MRLTMSKINQIKKRHLEFVEKNKAPDRPAYWHDLKHQNKITSFYQFPLPYQNEFKKFLAKVEKEYGKVKSIQLVGSMASGANYIPGKTSDEMLRARQTYYKQGFKKSDIDCVVIMEDGQKYIHKYVSDVVNIEGLPEVWQHGEIIYKNGKWR